jgi:hypothetical protein
LARIIVSWQLLPEPIRRLMRALLDAVVRTTPS